MKKKVTESNTKYKSGSKGAHGTHSMVLLGYCMDAVTGKEKHLYMLWNWWQKMFLVLVSFEYLLASWCRIYFLLPKLTLDMISGTMQYSDVLAAECAFSDHAENTCYF